MKARLLQKLINTKRPCVDCGESIAVGSSYVHDLISVNKETLKIKYAMDTFRKGRESVEGHGDLPAIWDSLAALIESGQIKEIIEGNDEIENKIPVFSVGREYQIIESHTDKFGWPNVTFDGQLMYNNTWFLTRKEAVADALKTAQADEKDYCQAIERKKDEIAILELEVNAARISIGELMAEVES